METLGVVLVALVVSFLSPVVLLIVGGRQAAAKEKRDNARQDVVAARAAKEKALEKAERDRAAQLLLEEQRATRASADKVVTTLEASDALTTKKLDGIEAGQERIHTLVNSNMTISIRGDHDSTVLLLAAYKRLAKLDPQPDDEVAIGVAEAKIAELSAQLSDREIQQDKIDNSSLAAEVKAGADA